MCALDLSYTGWGGGEGGNGHKVPILISKICIFTTNTATATKFDDFSLNLLRTTMIFY